jgi:hypothetical protein
VVELKRLLCQLGESRVETPIHLGVLVFSLFQQSKSERIRSRPCLPRERDAFLPLALPTSLSHSLLLSTRQRAMSGQNPLDNHKKAPGSSLSPSPVLIPLRLADRHPLFSPLLRPPAEIQKVATFLRNKADIKTKVGALGGKRHDYFKGPSSSSFTLNQHTEHGRNGQERAVAASQCRGGGPRRGGAA